MPANINRIKITGTITGVELQERRGPGDYFILCTLTCGETEIAYRLIFSSHCHPMAVGMVVFIEGLPDGLPDPYQGIYPEAITVQPPLKQDTLLSTLLDLLPNGNQIKSQLSRDRYSVIAQHIKNRDIEALESEGLGKDVSRRILAAYVSVYQTKRDAQQLTAAGVSMAEIETLSAFLPPSADPVRHLVKNPWAFYVTGVMSHEATEKLAEALQVPETSLSYLTKLVYECLSQNTKLNTYFTPEELQAAIGRTYAIEAIMKALNVLTQLNVVSNNTAAPELYVRPSIAVKDSFYAHTLDVLAGVGPNGFLTGVENHEFTNLSTELLNDDELQSLSTAMSGMERHRVLFIDLPTPQFNTAFIAALAFADSPHQTIVTGSVPKVSDPVTLVDSLAMLNSKSTHRIIITDPHLMDRHELEVLCNIMNCSLSSVAFVYDKNLHNGRTSDARSPFGILLRQCESVPRMSIRQQATRLPKAINQLLLGTVRKWEPVDGPGFRYHKVKFAPIEKVAETVLGAIAKSYQLRASEVTLVVPEEDDVQLCRSPVHGDAFKVDVLHDGTNAQTVVKKQISKISYQERLYPINHRPRIGPARALVAIVVNETFDKHDLIDWCLQGRQVVVIQRVSTV